MNNKKKPFYKKWWFIAIIAFFILGAIGGMLEDEEIEVTQTEEKIEVSKKQEVAVDEPEVSTIDTSVFENATSSDVSDAIDINKHVTVKLTVSEEATPGMAAQHVLNQTFKFLQQDDIQGAETVTIFITQKEKKIFQFTVNKNEFKPNETDPMSNLVLEASEVEMMSDEVKEFGATMEWPI